MKATKSIVFLLGLMMLLPLYSMVRGEENIWLKFTRQPNEANYRQCQDLVNDSLTGPYEKYHSPAFTSLMADHALGALLDLTEAGNSYAAHLCFQIYPLFYPGYPNILEDLDISCGKFLKKDPVTFLTLLKTYVIDGKKEVYYDLNGILGNYGEEFVDDSEKKLQETEERIKALESVDRKDLIDIQNKCLEYFYHERELYRRVLQKK